MWSDQPCDIFPLPRTFPLHNETADLILLSSDSKMAATSPSIPQLFTELERFGKDGNYEKAQKIANKSERTSWNYPSIRYRVLLIMTFLSLKFYKKNLTTRKRFIVKSFLWFINRAFVKLWMSSIRHLKRGKHSICVGTQYLIVNKKISELSIRLCSGTGP